MVRKWDAPFRYFVLAGLILLGIGLLWYARVLLQPLLAAGIIAYILSPAAGLLMARFELSRKVAARIVYFAILALLFLFVGTLVPIVREQVQSVRLDLQSALADLLIVLASPVQFGFLRLDLRLLGASLTALLNRGPIVAQPSQALRLLQMTSRGVVWAVVIIVSVYYLMTEWDELRAWVIGLAPPTEQSDLRRLYTQIRNVWQQYLRGQLRLIVILAVIYSVAWTIIGLPGAAALGMIAGLLNLIPEVGPAAIGILGTLIAYLEGSHILVGLSHPLFAVLTLGVYLSINAFKSVFLQPRILGRSVLLHEGLVFVAIVGALVLTGVLGVLIVVPVLASAIIVGRYLRRRLLGLPAFEDEEPGAPASEPAAARTGLSPQLVSSTGGAEPAGPSFQEKTSE
jgi:predicted PurR-regulated permease PerM